MVTPQANKNHMSSRIWNFTIIFYGFAGLQDLRFTKIYTAAHQIYCLLWAPRARGTC